MPNTSLVQKVIDASGAAQEFARDVVGDLGSKMGSGFDTPRAGTFLKGIASGISRWVELDFSPYLVYNLTYASTIDLDWNNGNIQNVVLTGNATFTFANPLPTGNKYQIFLTQDGTGSRTITWPSSVKWRGGTAPTLTTTASKTDIITLVYNPGYAVYFADISANFSS
jgi:hypothetical protein